MAVSSVTGGVLVASIVVLASLPSTLGPIQKRRINGTVAPPPNPTKNTGNQTMPEGKSEYPADVIALSDEAYAGHVQELGKIYGPTAAERERLFKQAIAKVILAERSAIATLLKDPAAVRIN